MSLLDTVTNEQQNDPPIIILYGVEGIGKTTIGSESDDVIFIRTEDGKGSLKFASFPKANTMQDVFNQLEALCAEDHNYKTLALDSLDWLQTLIWKHVAKINGKANIEDIGYGSGYKQALEYWDQYLGYIDYLNKTKKMTIYQIAHSDIKKFNDPEGEDYHVYSLKMHEGATSMLKEHADCVFFMKFEVFRQKQDAGFGQKKVKASGGERRVIYCQNHAAAHAKNRFGIDPKVYIDNPKEFWDMIKYYVPFFKQEGETKDETK